MPDIKTPGGTLIRRLFRIDPRKLVVDLSKNTRENSDTEIESLAQAFVTVGQKQPCGARRISDRKLGEPEDLMLEFGYRRYLASLMVNSLGLTGPKRPDASKPFELLVIVSDDDEAESFLANVSENTNIVRLNPIAQARAIERLEYEFLKTRAEIAKIFGHTEGWLSMRLKLLELPPELQQEVVKRNITPSAAYELAQEQDLVPGILEELDPAGPHAADQISVAEIEGATAKFPPDPYGEPLTENTQTPTLFEGEDFSTAFDEPSAQFAEPLPVEDPTRLEAERRDPGAQPQKSQPKKQSPKLTRSVIRKKAEERDTKAAKADFDLKPPDGKKKRKPKPRSLPELKAYFLFLSSDKEAAVDVRQLGFALLHFVYREIGEAELSSILEKLVHGRKS